MPPDSIVIVKLGGSLSRSDALFASLDGVERHSPGKAKVIVPGGGAFADQVRLAQQRFQIGDRYAHYMAILAMQQTAWLIKGLKPHYPIAAGAEAVTKSAGPGNIVIWSPDINELDSAGIAPSWDITSDSLAAWLALELSADELVLVKSAAIDPCLDLKQLTERQIVDKAFCGFAGRTTCKIRIVNEQCWSGSKPKLASVSET